MKTAPAALGADCWSRRFTLLTEIISILKKSATPFIVAVISSLRERLEPRFMIRNRENPCQDRSLVVQNSRKGKFANCLTRGLQTLDNF